MLFHTPTFLFGFLPLALGGFYLASRWGNGQTGLRLLILASVGFYGWARPADIALLGGSVLGNHGLARQISRHAREGKQILASRWLMGGITANLLLLGWFKYSSFLLHTLVPGATWAGVSLPLGVSFFTFQQIMFLVETRQNPARMAPLIGHAGFVTFFPHLIAGPIVQPREIIPQFLRPSFGRITTEDLERGLMIFLLGLIKKLVLADMFGGFADIGFRAAEEGLPITFFEAWYAALAYALQIYFDFSGYSDMAIGLARMFGIRFPANFDSPYKAKSITDFWRRWHITLGRFLRDYIYIPLGGSRCSTLRRNCNLLATMLLGGLWHGAGWNFVLWGGLHGLCLIVHAHWKRFARPLPGILANPLTLFVVVVAWIPFRADSFEATLGMLGGMAGLNGVALPRMIVQAIPLLGMIADPVPLLPYLGSARTLSFPEVSGCLLLGWVIVLALPHVHELTERGKSWALTAGFAFSIQALFFAPDVAPFLYFRF